MTSAGSDPTVPSFEQPELVRRDFLRVAGLTGAAFAASAPVQLLGPMLTKARAGGPPAPWSSPLTWGLAGMPTPATTVIIDKPVLLDVDARVAGVKIEPGGELIFDPDASRTLESSGNVENRGRLVMKPASPAVVHRLVFVDVEELRYVGGGMDPVASDVGLWIVDGGILDVVGSPKVAWARAAGGIVAGAVSFKLSVDPVGWRVGDEIILTPTLSPASPNSFSSYDTSTIVSIKGRSITLAAPTQFAHPAVTVAPGQTFTAEALNVSRNVRIEGTATGRAHVWSRSTQPQTVRYAAIRYMGPRQPSGKHTSDVVGRYSIHFHHSHDGSRGSLVEGVVVRNAGSHAFVPHLSHGITFRDCISHDTFEHAYWYDPRASKQDQPPPTHDALFDRCVASLVKFDPDERGIRLSGFWIGAGNGNRALNCVAVGIASRNDCAGFVWSATGGPGWVVEGCVSHNNRRNGMFVWKNTALSNPIRSSVMYHNAKFGVDHGAYSNSFAYEDCVMYGNRAGPLSLWAASRRPERLRFIGVLFDAAGLSEDAVTFNFMRAEAGQPTLFRGCTFKGHTRAALAWTEARAKNPHKVDVVDCTFEGNEFWLGKIMPAASEIRVQDRVRGPILLRRADQTGALVSKWNARLISIKPFV